MVRENTQSVTPSRSLDCEDYLRPEWISLDCNYLGYMRDVVLSPGQLLEVENFELSVPSSFLDRVFYNAITDLSQIVTAAFGVHHRTALVACQIVAGDVFNTGRSTTS